MEFEFDRTKCNKNLLMLKDLAIVTCGNEKLYPIIEDYFERVQLYIFELEGAKAEKLQLRETLRIIKKKCVDNIEIDSEQTYDDYFNQCLEEHIKESAICTENEYDLVKKSLERW